MVNFVVLIAKHFPRYKIDNPFLELLRYRTILVLYYTVRPMTAF